MLRRGFWSLACLIAVASLGGPAYAAENGPGLPILCQVGDFDCVTYDPSCLECRNTPTGRLCREVPYGDVGQQGCRGVFNGTTPTSCTTFGNFCSSITVNP
jgi:hypothetical protein